MHCRAVAVLVFTLFAERAAVAQSGRSGDRAQVILKNADEIMWTSGAAPGSGSVRLAGDPSQDGVYTQRSRIVPGGEPRAHMHHTWEFGTVLSGTLLVGIGEHIDRSSMKRLGPGAFIALPPETWHYTIAETPVELQQYGPGPRVTIYATPPGPSGLHPSFPKDRF